MKKPNIIDFINKKFGRLLAVKYIPGGNGKKAVWECVCDCGSTAFVPSDALKSGHTVSCGCRAKECLDLRTKHGLTGTKVFRTLNNMKTRCYNPNIPEYKYYGGRGIKICDRWLGPDGLQAFLEDVGPPPSPEHSIDRIDPDKDYEPGNCKWSLQQEQLANRRCSLRIEVDGLDLTASEWAGRLGVDYRTLYTRLRSGWDPVRAVVTPFKKYRKRRPAA